MPIRKKVWYLLAVLAIIFYTPYIALYIRCHGIPPDFFHFPATEPTPKEGPNALVIIIAGGALISFLLLLIYPPLFGFKKVAVERPLRKKVRLPAWFWIGLILWVGILIVFAAKISEPKWLLNWALLPLWWGFIHMLDGIVYYRNGGRSLVNDAPTELIAMGILSISGWLIFEYFNFFIDLNWYYPAAILLKHDEFLLYAVLGSSAFIPMAFEWYHLLRTFPAWNVRYKYGRPVSWSKGTRIFVGLLSLAGLFAAPFYPQSLFYVLWMGPLTILIIALTFIGNWTPFKAIKDSGDWTSLLVFAPTWLLQGLFIESWNYLSATHSGGQIVIPGTYNPGYWSYCIPFLPNIHVFEMPLLGYIGYVPFSIYCWIWFIAMAFLLNISSRFSLGEDFR